MLLYLLVYCLILAGTWLLITVQLTSAALENGPLVNNAVPLSEVRRVKTLCNSEVPQIVTMDIY